MIKTECVTSKMKSPRSFPKVMKNPTYTVIHKSELDGINMVGDFKDTWDMALFIDTDDKIVITSKET